MNEVSSRRDVVSDFLQRGVVGDFYARAGTEARAAIGLCEDADAMRRNAMELLRTAERLGASAMRTLHFVPATIGRAFLQTSDKDLQGFFQGLSPVCLADISFSPRLLSDPEFHVHMRGYLARVIRDYCEVQGRMTEERLVDTPRCAGHPERPSGNWVPYRFVDAASNAGGVDENNPAAVVEARAQFFQMSDSQHVTFLREMLRFDPEGSFAKPEWILPEHIMVSGGEVGKDGSAPVLFVKAHFVFPPEKDQPMFRKHFRVSGFRRVDSRGHFDCNF